MNVLFHILILLFFCASTAYAAPGKATLSSPSGIITDTTPTYTWNAVSGSTWYYLWVRDGSGGDVVKEWYTSESAGCSSGQSTCSVTHSTVLTAGTGTWWMQTWNSTGYGPWSSGQSFNVFDDSSSSAPGKATLTSPSSTITDTTPTYTWNAVSGSTWYYLWVRDGSGENIIKEWYTSESAGCSSGQSTCSVTHSTDLASGT